MMTTTTPATTTAATTAATTTTTTTPATTTAATTTTTTNSPPYRIDLDFTGVPQSDLPIFVEARQKWTQAITADLSDYSNTGGLSTSYTCDNGYPSVIDDLYICGRYIDIDGPGTILGSAGPIYLRSRGLLPISGRMEFDIPDIQRLRDRGTLDDVIIHEMGHILGVGTLWELLGLAGTDAQNCPYSGANANAAYQQASGCTTAVPLELDGGGGTRCGHFDEVCFGNEIMTGFLSGTTQPFSILTLSTMQDMGYIMDLSLAEPFTIDPSCTCTRRQLRGSGETSKVRHVRAVGRPELSLPARAQAVGYGQALLAQARAVGKTSPPPEGAMFVGDKVVSVLIEEDGNIFGVDVFADDF
eukprot:scaffold20186_cov239-Amphora_coffeaeformis.AAC.1